MKDCQGLGESEAWVGWAWMILGASENTVHGGTCLQPQPEGGGCEREPAELDSKF